MPTERELRALTRIADGCARRGDQAVFASYAQTYPVAERQLERQRRVAALLHAGGPEVPPQLRLRLAGPPPARTAARSHPAGARTSTPPRTLPRQRSAGVRTAAFAGLAMIALIAVIAWRAVSAGPQTPPTVDRVAQLQTRQSTSAPPAPGPSAFLRGEFAGVRFPNYQARFGARATGQRTDTEGGRTIRTVYYRLASGAEMSYSVVSGAALPNPPNGVRLTVAGVPIRSYQSQRTSYTVLVRDGRTCVLAGRVPGSTLRALAAAPLRGPNAV